MWEVKLSSAALTREQVAHALLSTAGYRLRLVRGWYVGFLGLLPAGKDSAVVAWAADLANGSSDEAVEALLLGSHPFQLRSMTP